MPIRFELLSRRHDRRGFTSGVPALDDWFQKRATQDQRRHVAQVFLAVDEQGIVGFYSLSMFTLALESLPHQLAQKLPRYEAIPAALIGRLARHERAKGSGIGDLLVADAVRRVLAAAQSVAAYAIVVDAKDDRGRRFYESHGFILLPSRPNRLFLLTETAAAALTAAAEPKEGE
ncbi:MAG: GNAT family N-acetyltransferase [Deltaproteobacteria bacterium]|nr:MAG: GNAT family N-acetyltransferase [Deltaproteobacteria bacterium]